MRISISCFLSSSVPHLTEVRCGTNRLRKRLSGSKGTGFTAAEKVPGGDETLPQRLKPSSFQSICVRPKGRTLQKDEFFRTCKARLILNHLRHSRALIQNRVFQPPVKPVPFIDSVFPQPVKPKYISGTYVRAKARTLQKNRVFPEPE